MLQRTGPGFLTPPARPHASWGRVSSASDEAFPRDNIPQREIWGEMLENWRPPVTVRMEVRLFAEKILAPLRMWVPREEPLPVFLNELNGAPPF